MRMKNTKTGNKSFVYLLIIIMICGNMVGLNFGANVVYAAGDLPNANGANGTQTKPYIINETSDFTWVFENNIARSSYLLQTADIDLSGFAWTPIGPNNATPFTGTYNGNGYTISNMTHNDGNVAYLGMFGYTTNATIKNVTLYNVSFTGGQVQNQAAIGAIAGMTTGTTLIERCHVTGTSSIIGATNDTIGGIVGSNGGSIKYCSNSATVSSSNYDSGSKPHSGGIAGSNWGSIDNSFNRGNVSCGTGMASAGGIVGFGYSNVLSNCYSTGTVTVGAGSEGGAIIGNITDAVNVSGNYYLSGVAANGIGKLDSVAGPSETGTTATSSADLKLEGTYDDSVWDFAGNTWILQSGINNDYPFIKGVAPVAVTIDATALTVTTGTVGGDVTSTGYGTISEKGIEYTKSAENSFTTVIASTSGTGVFSVDLSGLTPNTTYYVRAYAVNEVGTSYGEPILFTTNPLAPQLPLNLLQGNIVGTTKAVISDMTTDRFVVNITDASVGYVEAGDTAPSSGVNFIDNYVSGSDISNGVVVGKYLQIYDVDNLGEVVKFTEIQINNGHIKADNIMLPINEGFENGGSIPSNWGQQIVNSMGSNVNWTFTNTSTEDSVTATPYAGGYMAKADFYSSDAGASARLNLIRNFSLPEGGSYEFSFYMFHSTENDYGADDAIQPQISLNDGNTWTDLGTQIRRITGDTGWVKHTISLDAYAGESNVRVGFLAISNYGYSVFFDNVEIKSLALDAKALTADTSSNDVDHDIEITFGADAGFEVAVTGVSFNGTALTVTTDYVVSSGKITLKPSGGNAVLQTPATGNVVITATGYTNSTVAQTIQAGAVASLTITQEPVVGAASGNAFETQPIITMKDQYDNICSNGPSATANIVATAKAGTGTWTIGGTTTKAAVAGITTFTNLTCTLTAPGNGAMTFTSGIVTTDSNTFNIPAIAGKVLTADTTNHNVDYDIEVTFGADAGFEGAITGVSFNGTALTVTTDYVVSSGKITLKPSGGNAALQTPATGNVVIIATGYTNSTVSQTINHGVVAELFLTQDITAPTSNGGQFAQQPILTMKDQYGNTCTNNNGDQVTASKKDTGAWTLTGTLIKTVVDGTVTFTDLGATNTAQVNNTQIGFNVTGLTEVSSMAVTLPGPASSGGGNNSTSEITPQPTGTSDVEVLVNGQSESAGTATTTTVDNRTTTIITVDADKLEQRLESEGNHAVVTIPVNTNADVVVGELNGQMVKNMETKQAVVEVKTETATYTLPARQINIDAISEQVGADVELKDIKVQIEISKASDETVQVVENASNKGEFTIVVPPMEFTIKCIHNNQTYEVSKFNAYVERTVAIPEGVDPSKITTGIVVEPDGTVRHVPTQIILIDGKYYAKINSLTNSTYSVVYNPIEFKDAANHWAKDAINDMGSRMVISGMGNGMFEPNRDITRAEFAAIIVRALGLKPGTSINPFTDVSNNDWYKKYVETAYEYGIISGYGNNKFGSMDKITREQAMTMIANTMKITGLEVELTQEEINSLLSGFGDSGQSSEWAKESLATCLKTEIVSGKGSNILAPKDNITRAEVAVIVKRMLQKSKLI